MNTQSYNQNQNQNQNQNEFKKREMKAMEKMTQINVITKGIVMKVERTMMNLSGLSKVFMQMVAALSVMVLFAGCSGNPEKPTMGDINKGNPCYFMDSREDAPDWICTEYVEGVVTGVGSFPPSMASHNLKFQTAKQRARVSLTKKIEVSLKGALEEFEQNTRTSGAEVQDLNVTNLSKSRIDSTLQGTRVYSSITGPDGTFYVLVGIDEKLAKENMKRLIRTGFGNREAQYISDKAKQAMVELDRSIDNRYMQGEM